MTVLTALSERRYRACAAINGNNAVPRTCQRQFSRQELNEGIAGDSNNKKRKAKSSAN